MSKKLTIAELKKQFPGLSKPTKPKINNKALVGKYREIIHFACDNSLIINPNGYGYYIEGYFIFGHCPCDKKRLDCPCQESLEEIKTAGKCKCQLFWRDYETFVKEKL